MASGRGVSAVTLCDGGVSSSVLATASVTQQLDGAVTCMAKSAVATQCGCCARSTQQWHGCIWALVVCVLLPFLYGKTRMKPRPRYQSVVTVKLTGRASAASNGTALACTVLTVFAQTAQAQALVAMPSIDCWGTKPVHACIALIAISRRPQHGDCSIAAHA